jgi:hypothetical protein
VPDPLADAVIVHTGAASGQRPDCVPARPAAPAAGEGGVVRGDGTVKARVPAGRYTVELLVLPARVGFNQLHVTVYAPGGNSARVRTFAARLVPPGGGAAIEPAAERVGDWTFTLNLKVREVSDAGAEITPERAISVPVVVPVG